MGKIILIVTCLAILLLGCSDTLHPITPTEEVSISTEDTSIAYSEPLPESVLVDGIDVSEIQYVKTEWDKIEEGYRVDVTELDLWNETNAVDTNHAAVATGKAIIEELHSKDRYPEHNLIWVCHSIEDHAWYYLYRRPWVYGDYLWVGIDGNDGNLLGAYTTH